MRTILSRLATDEAGATAVEYCLIASFIALVCIGIWRQTGQALEVPFTTARNGLQ